MDSNISGDIRSPKTRKSCVQIFDFITKCIFCGTEAKVNGRKRGNDVYPVRTLEFQTTIRDVCIKRSDNWSDTVLGRLEFARDLPAVEARYHQKCSSNFRSGCNIPKIYQKFNETDNVKKGRPSMPTAETAFHEVITYFESNPSEQMTVSDFVDKMEELCDECYSMVYMKKKDP